MYIKYYSKFSFSCSFSTQKNYPVNCIPANYYLLHESSSSNSCHLTGTNTHCKPSTHCNYLSWLKRTLEAKCWLLFGVHIIFGQFKGCKSSEHNLSWRLEKFWTTLKVMKTNLIDSENVSRYKIRKFITNCKLY